MQTILILLQKLLLIAVPTLVGFFCGKKGLLDDKTNGKLSELLLNIIMPCVIFTSYQIEYDEALSKNLLLCLGLAVLCYVIHFACAYLFIKKSSPHAAIERLSVLYSNCGFMGIPLASALFGAEGVLYLTVHLTCLNLLLWTHGVFVMSGKTSLRSLLSPSLFAIVLGVACYFLKLRLPQFLLDPLESLGSVNTPLAMLVAGASITKTSLRDGLSNKRLLPVALLRNVAIPLAVALVLWKLPVGELPATVMLLASACPTAAVCTMFAKRYQRDEAYAAQIFALSTALSLLTLPCILLLFTFLRSL